MLRFGMLQTPICTLLVVIKSSVRRQRHSTRQDGNPTRITHPSPNPQIQPIPVQTTPTRRFPNLLNSKLRRPEIQQQPHLQPKHLQIIPHLHTCRRSNSETAFNSTKTTSSTKNPPAVYPPAPPHKKPASHTPAQTTSPAAPSHTPTPADKSPPETHYPIDVCTFIAHPITRPVTSGYLRPASRKLITPYEPIPRTTNPPYTPAASPPPKMANPANSNQNPNNQHQIPKSHPKSQKSRFRQRPCQHFRNFP